jgi:hypothetical protein
MKKFQFFIAPVLTLMVCCQIEAQDISTSKKYVISYDVLSGGQAKHPVNLALEYRVDPMFSIQLTSRYFQFGDTDIAEQTIISNYSYEEVFYSPMGFWSKTITTAPKNGSFTTLAHHQGIYLGLGTKFMTPLGKTPKARYYIAPELQYFRYKSDKIEFDRQRGVPNGNTISVTQRTSIVQNVPRREFKAGFSTGFEFDVHPNVVVGFGCNMTLSSIARWERNGLIKGKVPAEMVRQPSRPYSIFNLNFELRVGYQF